MKLKLKKKFNLTPPYKVNSKKKMNNKNNTKLHLFQMKIIKIKSAVIIII